MQLIDTHTHLYADAFDLDRTAMINSAINNGVQTMLMPNIDLQSVEGMYALCDEFPKNCLPMMGLHPCYVNKDFEKQLEDIYVFLKQRNHVAIGEIGIDLYWDKTLKEEQEQVFETQILWAKEMNLPIVIHAREAFDEIFRIVDRHIDENLRGVFHCFTGSIEQFEKIASYQNFMVGIGGVLTYPKSGLDHVVHKIPLDYIVLETDAPYLPPVPFRGKRNESAYLMYIAEKLAGIKQVTIEEIAERSTFNARKMFDLKG